MIDSATTANDVGAQTRGAHEIRAWLVDYAAQRMRILPEEVDVHAPLTRYGLDSMDAIVLASELESWLGRPVSPTDLWKHPNIYALGTSLAMDDALSDLEQGAGRAAG